MSTTHGVAQVKLNTPEANQNRYIFFTITKCSKLALLNICIFTKSQKNTKISFWMIRSFPKFSKAQNFNIFTQ